MSDRHLQPSQLTHAVFNAIDRPARDEKFARLRSATLAWRVAVRVVIPRVEGRGAGLGNELFGWGKAFIAGEVLGIPAFHPAWGLNRRGYREYFGTSSADWIVHRALAAALPRYRLDEEAFRRLGQPDFADAVQSFAEQHSLHRKRAYALEVDGMWGGFDTISMSREFLWAKLLGTKATLGNVLELDRKLPRDGLRIGVHIRRGDFASPGNDADYHQKFNIALPMGWYRSVLEQLHAALGNKASFIVFSDASPDELEVLSKSVPVHLTHHQAMRDVSDLVQLARCDLIVCSISSFSLWAAFFSSGRYLWFAPQLTLDAGTASIWGHEPSQQSASSATSVGKRFLSLAHAADTRPKGVPLAEGDPVPAELIEFLNERFAVKRRETDLLRYGSVPMSA